MSYTTKSRFVLGLVLLASAFVACDVEEGEVKRTPEGPTREQGLTVKVASPRVLHLVHLEGEHQLRLLVARAPHQEEGYDTLCLRLADDAGWPFLQAGVVASCGADFFRSPAASSRSSLGYDGTAALQRRNLQVVELLHAMRAAQAPKEVAPLWAHALRHLESFTVRPELLAFGPKNQTAEAEKNEENAPTPSLFDASTVTSLGPRDGTQTVAKAGASYFLGPLDPLIKKNASPRELVVQSGMEFRQQVDLYAKKTQRYLFAGELTDIDHSAAHITVFSRRQASQQPWTMFAETWTQNHGTAIGHPTMEAYATCTELPVTEGYFAWKGECPGTWGGDHICNDDTRYQIWHAYGMWNEEEYCDRPFQAERPTCDKPW